MKKTTINNNTVIAKKQIKKAEALLSSHLLKDQEVEVLIAALVQNLAKLYGTSDKEIEDHLDLGIQVSIGFDYSFDFVKEKFKQNPLKSKIQEDAISFKIQEREALRRARDKRELEQELTFTESSLFKKLSLLGSMVSKGPSKWLSTIINSLK
jgi:hypothetical protein